MTRPGGIFRLTKTAKLMVGAAVVEAAWAATGVIWGWSDGWERVFSVGTTVVAATTMALTLLAQDRDTAAMHAKLDEVVRAIPPANNELIAIERKV